MQVYGLQYGAGSWWLCTFSGRSIPAGDCARKQARSAMSASRKDFSPSGKTSSVPPGAEARTNILKHLSKNSRGTNSLSPRRTYPRSRMTSKGVVSVTGRGAPLTVECFEISPPSRSLSAIAAFTLSSSSVNTIFTAFRGEIGGLLATLYPSATNVPAYMLSRPSTK